MHTSNEQIKVQIACVLDKDVRNIVLHKCRALGIDSAEYFRQLILKDLKSEGLLEERIHAPPEKLLAP